MSHESFGDLITAVGEAWVRRSMANVTSFVRAARIASTSPRSIASMKRWTMARSRSSPSDRSVACWLSWEASSIVLRAPLQGAVDGRRHQSSAAAASLAEPEDLAQEQHRALARGQVLERHDERELNAGFALLVAGLGPRRLVVERKQLLGERLQAGRRAGVAGGAAPLPARDRVKARVGGDLVEPRLERPLVVESR